MNWPIAIMSPKDYIPFYSSLVCLKLLKAISLIRKQVCMGLNVTTESSEESQVLERALG